MEDDQDDHVSRNDGRLQLDLASTSRYTSQLYYWGLSLASLQNKEEDIRTQQILQAKKQAKLSTAPPPTIIRSNNTKNHRARAVSKADTPIITGREMVSVLGGERDFNFKETELCLGLPGGGGGGGCCAGGKNGVVETPKSTGKRGFAETVNLKLNLQAKEGGMDLNENIKNMPSKEKSIKDPVKPPAKAQVVGWPPVRSYRKNVMSQKNSGEDGGSGGGAAFVKVCMDGAPYLRKVDLKMYKSYQELSDALAKMFSSFTMGNYGAQGMIDFMNESKLMDLLNSSDYVPTYEDKDGDWMLVGDVPWEMFVDSCKRLRIMKGSEAIGLAPRAMEKCKSRG